MFLVYSVIVCKGTHNMWNMQIEEEKFKSVTLGFTAFTKAVRRLKESEGKKTIMTKKKLLS